MTRAGPRSAIGLSSGRGSRRWRRGANELRGPARSRRPAPLALEAPAERGELVEAHGGQRAVLLGLRRASRPLLHLDNAAIQKTVFIDNANIPTTALEITRYPMDFLIANGAAASRRWARTAFAPH